MTENKYSISYFVTITSLALFIFTSSCTKKSNTATPANLSTAPSQSALAEQGKAIFQTQCTACHNSDPKKPGAIGPDIWGSSKELIEARVLSASYPQGYKPKRETKAMLPLPHLKDQIDALHAYLNQ